MFDLFSFPFFLVLQLGETRSTDLYNCDKTLKTKERVDGAVSEGATAPPPPMRWSRRRWYNVHITGSYVKKVQVLFQEQCVLTNEEERNLSWIDVKHLKTRSHVKIPATEYIERIP